MVSQDNLSDEQLVVMVRESSKELFGEIIRRYQLKLTHYLRKFIHDNDELEDVLQDVFIKSFRNLYNFNASKRFSPWIYRIAHNEAVNHIKKYKNKSISLDEKEWELIDDSVSIPENFDASLVKSKVEKCLAQIKDKYREPLILYYFEQNTYEEISDILRMPRNTVGTLIGRGKNLLKEYLQLELYGKPKQ